MAEQRRDPVIPARGDYIRIVPVATLDDIARPIGEAAAAPATRPNLTYRGGPLLSAVEVFTVFWGSAWQAAPQSGLMQSLNQFFDFVLTSPLINQLGEYSTPHYPIGPGKRTGTTVVPMPAHHVSLSDLAVQHMLQQEISTNPAFPQPTANTLYFVYLPPGVSVSQGGSKSCQAFCGYHNDISGHIFYALMPYPGCAGCTGGLSTLDALTSTSSHELSESITDAIPGQGWYDDANGEIGDICAWKTKRLGQFTVQQEWSDHSGACG